MTDEPEPSVSDEETADADPAIDHFRYETTKLTLLRTYLQCAREGTLSPDWRETLTDVHTAGHEAQARAIAGIAETPPADWEPDQDVGWRRALDSWHEATTQCLTATDEIQQRLLTAKAATPAVHKAAQNTLIARDLATASYRAGMAAAGLDIDDWFEWLIDRVNQWPDPRRRNEQLDLMNLEPGYRDTIQQLPLYWR